MLLGIFGFLNMSFVDFLDIILVAFLIFFLFRWIRGSSAMTILITVVLLLIVRVIVEALNMKLMSALMGAVVDIGILALIVLFQPEITTDPSTHKRIKKMIQGMSYQSAASLVSAKEIEEREKEPTP